MSSPSTNNNGTADKSNTDNCGKEGSNNEFRFKAPSENNELIDKQLSNVASDNTSGSCSSDDIDAVAEGIKSVNISNLDTFTADSDNGTDISNTANCENLEDSKLDAEKLHDDLLFKQPQKDEDCPICFQRMPLYMTGRRYMPCCGKTICSGCDHAPVYDVYDDKGNEVDNKKCPFCKTPPPTSDEEIVKRMENLVEAGDAEAINNMGGHYENGRYGLTQDHTKALELYHQAAKLGNAQAYYNIALYYDDGKGIEVEKKKARHYYELAAMQGHVNAMGCLGMIEGQVGNHNRALRHFMIAAKGGCDRSLETIRKMITIGHATKDDYTKALESYQVYLDEIKSDQRDKAAAARECYKYYKLTPEEEEECNKCKSVADLYDENLFKQPPLQYEDCPICFQRMPSLRWGYRYKSCCGKVICSGCVYAPVYDDQGNEVDNEKCPFCRAPTPYTDEEIVEREKKRLDAGDAEAIHNRGCYYHKGMYSLPQDYEKALELWHKAAELGHSRAYYCIGIAYSIGIGVEVDMEKALHYFELAAMGGVVEARRNLGVFEENIGNTDRALKHFMIAVRCGCNDSLEEMREMVTNGHATKEDYAEALRSFQEYLGEIKSRQRDKAAAADEDYKYY